MTEAAWRACRNPLRMPKVLRGRPPRRKCALLSCAYVLDPVAGFRGEFARRVAAAAQAAWVASDPRAGTGTEVAAALRKAFPDELTGETGAPVDVVRRLRGLRDYHLLSQFLVAVAGRSLPDRAAANSIAEGCLRAARNEARAEAGRRLNELRATHRSPDDLRKAVLGLLPEVERGRFSLLPWPADQSSWGLATRLGSCAAAARAAEVSTRLADLVREIVGNPFRPIVVRPEWREANFGAAARIAEHVTATGDYSQVPVLADALEDAGCDDAELLAHCRDPRQVHVAGCWAVDAVLGRN